MQVFTCMSRCENSMRTGFIDLTGRVLAGSAAFRFSEPSCRRASARRARRRRPERIGIEKKNVLPCPSVLSTQMRPPCASTMPFAIVQPEPRAESARARRRLPEPIEDVREVLRADAAPVSATENTTSRSLHAARTVMRPPSGVNLIALPIRLSKTRRSRSRSPWTSVGVAPEVDVQVELCRGRERRLRFHDVARECRHGHRLVLDRQLSRLDASRRRGDPGSSCSCAWPRA